MSNQIESQLTSKEIHKIFERTEDYVQSFKNMLDKQDRLNDLIVTKKEHELSEIFVQRLLDTYSDYSTESHNV